MAFGLKDTDIDLILSVFREYPAIKEVVIFGSRAMGNFKHGSDVDLALKGAISDELLSVVRIRLNEELPLPYVFDIFDHNAISNEALLKHISEYGRTLYSAL